MSKLSDLSISDLKVTLDYIQETKQDALNRIKNGEERDEVYLKRLDKFSFHVAVTLERKVFQYEIQNDVK